MWCRETAASGIVDVAHYFLQEDIQLGYVMPVGVWKTQQACFLSTKIYCTDISGKKYHPKRYGVLQVRREREYSMQGVSECIKNNSVKITSDGQGK